MVLRLLWSAYKRNAGCHIHILLLVVAITKLALTKHCSESDKTYVEPFINVTWFSPASNRSDPISGVGVFEVPNNLNEIHFSCYADFPIEWAFQQYPFVFTWNITTIRYSDLNNTTALVTTAYMSRFSIYGFRGNYIQYSRPTCRGTGKHNCSRTEVTITNLDANSITFKIEGSVGTKYNTCFCGLVTSDELKEPLGRYGANQNCTLSLKYDEKSQQFYCYSKLGQVTNVRFWSCEDPITCGRIVQPSSCRNDDDFTFQNCTPSTNCSTAAMQIDYLPAATLCSLPSNEPQISASIPYFYSLTDGMKNTPKRYFHWNDVLPTDMMQVSYESTKHYAGDSFIVNCLASYFYFAEGLRFTLGNYPSGPPAKVNIDYVVIVKENDNFVTTSYGFVPRLHVLQITLKILKTGMFELVCHAPVWNTTEWVSKSVPIFIYNSTKPYFLNGNDTIQEKFEPFKLVTCSATGVPLPVVYWSKADHPLEASVDLKVDENDTFRWSTLQLPSLSEASFGDYICHAENSAGKVSKIYRIQEVQDQWKTWGAVIAVLVLILVLTPTLIFLIWKVWSQKKQMKMLTDEEVHEFKYGKHEYVPIDCDVKAFAYFLPYDQKFEIPRECLEIDYSKILGSGEFGLVLQSKLFSGEAEGKVIAIKTTKPPTNDVSFKALLSELKIMTYIGKHENIVNLIGACTRDIRKREVFIAIEYCQFGSLLNFLRQRQEAYFASQSNIMGDSFPYIPFNALYTSTGANTVQYVKVSEELTYGQLVHWCFQVADGMKFLSLQKIIHSDLAARNILLTKELVAKIGDFGLSRQLLNYRNYTSVPNMQLPFKWMALESLQDMNISVESDVWAFGITMWEIFSLGAVPYPGILTPRELLDFISQGNRLPCPQYTTPDTYDIILKCWAAERRDRPAFSQIAAELRQLLENWNFANSCHEP